MWQIGFEFSVEVPGGQAEPQYNVVRRYRRFTPSAENPCPRVDLTGSVGLAGLPSLAGVQLDNDDVVVALDAEGVVELTWPLAVEGVVHATRVALYELVPMNGKTTFVHRRSVYTSGETVHFDRSELPANRYFMIALEGRLDLPNAEDGDFATFREPFEYSTVWSHRFRVVDR